MIYNYERNKDKKIPVRIRQEREISGLTQDLLAEKIGLSRQTLINYESGKSPVPIDVILKMCEVFGCEAEYLLCASDQRNRVNTDLCRATRLSEKAVENILDLNRGTKPLIGDLRTEDIKALDKILSNKELKYLLRAISDYRNNKESDKDSQDFELFKLQKRFINLVNNFDDKN